MKKQMIRTMITLFILSVLLYAQGVPKLELTVIDTKVNMTQAEKEGKAAITYKPGDIIRYTIIASNTGNGMLTSPLITNPIPKGVTYMPLSAKGLNSKITYSMNNGTLFQPWPVTYNIKDKNGKTIKMMASPDMITHVRWELTKSLAPNESHQLEFEVTVK